MKKHLIVIGMVALLLVVGLSGCTDTQQDDQGSGIDKFELLSYSVETMEDSYPEDRKIGDGFIHSEDADYYQINGIIKNKAGYKTDIIVTMKFYDEKDIFLDSETIKIYEVPDNYEESFKSRVWKSGLTGLDYFDKVKKVTFDLKED
jgi:hypothetical protein